MESGPENHSSPYANLQDLTRRVAAIVLRYGLVLVIVWFAAMKFTHLEAAGIQPLVSKSPLLGWMYRFLSVQQFSTGLGCVELLVALLVACRPVSTRVCAVGSLAAVGMFLTTLSFLVSTPGWEPSLGGFPAPSLMVGEFLIKDIVLLGVAFWSLAEAWGAAIGAPSTR